MKIVGLDYNSSLVFVVKISAQSKMFQRFGMHFSARGFSFGLYLQCKNGAFFTIARLFLDTKKFMTFFITKVFLR